MKKTTKIGIFVGAGAFLLGALTMGVVMFFSAPTLMMMEDESRYGFEETIDRFETKVDDAGWSIVNTHDMQAVLEGHGYDVDRVETFELCSSEYSAEILKLDDERIVSPLMPCRISIYETSDGSVHIARMNSSLMARTFGGVINDVMQKAAAETEEIIDPLLE